MEASTSKRKALHNAVVFRDCCEEQCLFGEFDGCLKCLVCHKLLNCAKTYNVKRHFETYHVNYFLDTMSQVQKLKQKLVEAEGTELEGVSFF